MPSDELSIEEARRELIRRLVNCDYGISKKANATARQILHAKTDIPTTEGAVIDFILRLLTSDFPIHAVLQGDPPGSWGVGYELRDVDGQGLYIKLKLEERKAMLVSFHY